MTLFELIDKAPITVCVLALIIGMTLCDTAKAIASRVSSCDAKTGEDDTDSEG